MKLQKSYNRSVRIQKTTASVHGIQLPCTDASDIYMIIY